MGAVGFTSLDNVQPGQIHLEGHRLFAACAQNTWIELLEVQLEGKKRLMTAEFLRGTALAVGARLGTPAQ
jgi:methionyl-tRNA formyltransferase